MNSLSNYDTSIAIDPLGPVNYLHPLNRGLVGWWLAVPGGRSGYGTGKWRDLTHYRNDGTLTNMDAATDWKASGLDFDGFDDSVFIANSPLPDTPPPMSVCVVFKANSTAVSRHGIYCNNNSSTPRMYLELQQVSGTTYHQRLFSNSGYVDGDDFTLDTTAFHCYGWTWDSDGSVAFYRDGLLAGTATRTVDGASTAGAWIGSLDGTNFIATGIISSLRLLTRVMSAAEMFQYSLEAKQLHPNLLNRVRVPVYAPTAAPGGVSPFFFNTFIRNRRRTA